MIIQSTLLTCHKGVDLHAETASRVMRAALDGGSRLAALRRAEFHAFWHDQDEPAPESVARLLGVGRFFNPNKHHYAHCELVGAAQPWFRRGAPRQGEPLPSGWPGEILETDLPDADSSPLDRLLGGPTSAGQAVFDVCAFPLGEEGPLLSGVLWRLVLDPEGPDAAADAARSLIVARGAREGLLVNPHMQGWLLNERGAA